MPTKRPTRALELPSHAGKIDDKLIRPGLLGAVQASCRASILLVITVAAWHAASSRWPAIEAADRQQ